MFSILIIAILSINHINGFKYLSSEMYSSFVSVSACVRHLNGTTYIGCQGSSNGVSNGILYRLSNDDELDKLYEMRDDYVVVVSTKYFKRDLIETLKLHAKVKGIIVPFILTNRSFGVFQNYGVPNNFSDEVSSKWNPYGRDLFDIQVHFPIIGIAPDDNDAIDSLSNALSHNLNQSYSQYPLYGAQLDSFMYATSDSETCLRRSVGQPRPLCWPFGGNSVYSSVMQGAQAENSSIIWISATADTRSIFPDFSFGYDAYQSGVIASLAIADTLSNSVNVTTLKNNIVFTFFNAESWGQAGSSRFFRDVNEFTCKTPIDNGGCQQPFFVNTDFKKFNLDNTMLYIELGQLLNSNDTIFSHSSQRYSSFEFLLSSNTGSSLQYKQVNTASDVSQLPLSSYSSFAKYTSGKPNVIFNDFSDFYSNQFYNSAYDNEIFFNNASASVEKICNVANMISKSVYGLAVGNSTSTDVKNVNVNCSYVTELFNCLMVDFGCDLVGKTGIQVSGSGNILRYPFAFQSDFNSQTPDSGNAYTAFLMRTMRKKFSTEISNSNCITSSDCDNGQFCNSQGICSNSLTGYHDAYGLGLEYDYGKQRFTVVDKTLPSWTVSNFNTIGMRIFLVDPSGNQTGELVGGIIITILSAIGTFYGRRFLFHKFKLA